MLSNKFAEALSLMKHAKQLAVRASEEIAACDEMRDGEKFIEELGMLQEDISKMMMRVQAKAYIGTTSLSSKSKDDNTFPISRISNPTTF
jgi:hypothetical protein